MILLKTLSMILIIKNRQIQRKKIAMTFLILRFNQWMK